MLRPGAWTAGRGHSSESEPHRRGRADLQFRSAFTCSGHADPRRSSCLQASICEACSCASRHLAGRSSRASHQRRRRALPRGKSQACERQTDSSHVTVLGLYMNTGSFNASLMPSLSDLYHTGMMRSLSEQFTVEAWPASFSRFTVDHDALLSTAWVAVSIAGQPGRACPDCNVVRASRPCEQSVPCVTVPVSHPRDDKETAATVPSESCAMGGAEARTERPVLLDAAL